MPAFAALEKWPAGGGKPDKDREVYDDSEEFSKSPVA
jgi:hypothetical protein